MDTDFYKSGVLATGEALRMPMMAESNDSEDNPGGEVMEKNTQLPRPIHGFEWVSVVVSLLASFLLYALDTTIVATIQPAIVLTFGSVELVPWLSVSFAFASAASTLPWSRAFGTFSAKKLFIGGTTLFMGASALCGAAPDKVVKQNDIKIS